jgi:tetratricopeptide (TPR) repeat protein
VAPAAALDPAPLIAQLNAGRFAEVEVSAQSLIARYADAGILWKLLGAALFKQGKDALPSLETAARLLPNDPESHTNLGNVLRSRGRFEDALACHRRAIELKADYAEAHNNLGSVLRDLGRSDAAVASYRSALAIKPDFALAHHNLGAALRNLGRLDEAVTSLRRSVVLRPDLAALLSLSDTLLELGRLDEAAASYRRLLELEPDRAEAHNNLGNALRDLGQPEEAAGSYRRAIELRPNTAELHNNLGNALLDLGRIEEAAQSYQRALELKPDFARAHSNLGSAFRELGKLEEAESTYHRACALQPDSAEILTNLGVVQRLQGRASAAEMSLRRALELNPKAPASMTSFADLLADQGQFAEAERWYRQAHSAKPNAAQAWAGIAALRKMNGTDGGWIDEAQRLAGQALRPREAVQLSYAMGKYFDDVGDYQRAFENYRRANEITKTYRPPHDPQLLGRTFAFAAELYDRDWVTRASVHGARSQRPVFVVGMPRSGTSLTEQILASHPAVHGAGELTFWKLASLEVGAASLQAGPSEVALSTLAQDYLRSLADLAPDTARVVDKMPGNFAHLGMIHAALPEARIIHMRRNPIDTCLSIYFNNFHIAHSYANDLEDLARYYEEYNRLMIHWRSILPSETILEVPYEALVEDPESWSRKMIAFLGLPWDGACLEFHRTKRNVSTFSKWQVRQKITRGSVERWRNYAAFIEPLLRLSACGA